MSTRWGGGEMHLARVLPHRVGHPPALRHGGLEIQRPLQPLCLEGTGGCPLELPLLAPCLDVRVVSMTCS